MSSKRHSVADRVIFLIPGKPQGKQRPRLGKGGRVYTPAATATYERHVALSYLVATGGQKRQDYTGSVELRIACTFNDLRRRDLDNVVKAVADGLNGIAYADDCQVTRILAERRQGAPECTEVTVVYAETTPNSTPNDSAPQAVKSNHTAAH